MAVGGWNTRLIARCGAAASSIFLLNTVLKEGICMLRPAPENMCCSFCFIMIIFMYSSGATGWGKHICTQKAACHGGCFFSCHSALRRTRGSGAYHVRTSRSAPAASCQAQPRFVRPWSLTGAAKYAVTNELHSQCGNDLNGNSC